MIKEVIEVLTPTQEKKKKTDQQYGIPSDKKVFEDDILPQIESAITTYLARQNRSIDLQWNVNLDFLQIIDEGKMESLDIIKDTYEKILAEEKKLTNILLLTAYARGLSYLAARPFVKGNIKVFYQQEFATSYVTVTRYQRLAMMIMAYPGLLVTGLSFLECLKHHNRILDHLVKNKPLASKLRTVVIVSVQGIGFEVVPVDVNTVPRVQGKLNTDPDCVYEKDT